MWVVTWLGRKDPDPRVAPQSSVCATFASARDAARRIALEGGVGVRVKKVEGEASGSVSRWRRQVTVDERGCCVHELKAEWCALCRSGR
jgi:hypothetical protein